MNGDHFQCKACVSAPASLSNFSMSVGDVVGAGVAIVALCDRGETIQTGEFRRSEDGVWSMVCAGEHWLSFVPQ
jgi:hypothetical protein